MHKIFDFICISCENVVPLHRKKKRYTLFYHDNVKLYFILFIIIKISYE